MQRTFITGDKWLYYKLYSGTKTADMLLADVVYPVSNKLYNNRIIDKWFFIRYADPKPHLRWRLCLSETKMLGDDITEIFNACDKYLKNGLIYKVQTDTYKRELERYGTNTIELSETLFHHDSVMIVKMLDLIEGDEGERVRWMFALRAIDELLDSFNYSTNDKFVLLETLAMNFGREFNLNSGLIQQLSNKYRKEKKYIFDFMNREKDENSDYKELFDLLSEKSENTKRTVSKILQIQREGNLQVPLDNLLSSYIHMLMNRLFRSNQRLHEMVLYGFLFRFYRSELAKEKYWKQ